MISQTVEYALRAIVTIAQYEGQPCTAAQISRITQVPAPYLSKLMQGLVRAGIASSQRGLHGGFLLARDANELTIWEVVDAVEPIKRILECPLGIATHGGTLCPLHRKLDNALALVEESFRSTTVTDLLAQPGSVTPLCEEKKLFMIQESLAAKKVSSTKNSSSKDSSSKDSSSKDSSSKDSSSKDSSTPVSSKAAPKKPRKD